MVMSRQALVEYLDRERTSFNWMKRLRRHAIEQAVAELPGRPQFKTPSWLHQLVCFYIGACEPRFLFLLDMGLGKSKILSDLMTYRIKRRQVDRALVTVPNVINMASWRDDLGKHTDLEPWTCDIENIEEKWERLAHPRGEVTVIDYQGLTWALCKKVKKGKRHILVPDEDRVDRVRKLYPFIGTDESHKLKNHQGLWFELLNYLTETARYAYATTGTVFGKNPEDMWSQFYLVDRGETFGENLGLFREAFFLQKTDNFGTTWTFNKRTAPELHQFMQHRSIRYDEEEVPEIDIPKRAPPIILKLDMGDEQREHYLRALEGLINAQGGDPSLLEAPWIRMRQILSGYLIWEDGSGRHRVVFKHNPKLLATERLLYEMGDSKMIVCHYFTDTGEIVADHIRKLGFGVERLYGGTKDKQAVRRRFMEDPNLQVLVMNEDTGGTGNDGLQEVANYMTFYESPTGPDKRKQVMKRIHRPGQRKRTFFYDLVMRRTIDQGILDSIAEGQDLYEAVVNGRRLRRGMFTG